MTFSFEKLQAKNVNFRKKHIDNCVFSTDKSTHKTSHLEKLRNFKKNCQFLRTSLEKYKQYKRPIVKDSVTSISKEIDNNHTRKFLPNYTTIVDINYRKIR